MGNVCAKELTLASKLPFAMLVIYKKAFTTHLHI